MKKKMARLLTGAFIIVSCIGLFVTNCFASGSYYFNFDSLTYETYKSPDMTFDKEYITIGVESFNADNDTDYVTVQLKEKKLVLLR